MESGFEYLRSDVKVNSIEKKKKKQQLFLRRLREQFLLFLKCHFISQIVILNQIFFLFINLY